MTVPNCGRTGMASLSEGQGDDTPTGLDPRRMG
jgi:hypothetical protein